MSTQPRPIEARDLQPQDGGPEAIARIRQLNDDLRCRGLAGDIIISPAVQELGTEKTRAVMQAVAAFSEFTQANDPYGEHDFGQLEVNGIAVVWKIDYFDTTRTYYSPDPADPTVTARLLTVMLASDA